MSSIMETFATEPTGAGRGLVIAAYDTPRFSTPENQDQAVRDFTNEAELACFKAQ